MNDPEPTPLAAPSTIAAAGPDSIGAPRVRSFMIAVLRYTSPMIALAAGILVALHLLETKPEAKPMPATKNRLAVETTVVSFSSHPTLIQAMGVVQAAQSIDLKAQISGQVIAISEKLLPGGRFAQGDTLLQLEPSEYQLTLRQQENAVIQARNNLAIEEGQQLVVRKEYDLLDESVSEAERQLMLRQPQLRTLQSELAIAQAKMEQARIQLARTTVKAPFNGVVRACAVNVGTVASTSTTLATLVGSDSYWVEVSVPEEQLRWISFPSTADDAGSRARIFNPTAWEEGAFREGRVIQLLPALESQGRMARVLIEVADPLALDPADQGKKPVMIDAFVRVEIEGKPIPRSAELPRAYLRDGNKIWLYDEHDRLAVREVDVAFRGSEKVLVVSGIEPGNEIVVTDIPTPVVGMALAHLEQRPLLSIEDPIASLTMRPQETEQSEGGGER